MRPVIMSCRAWNINPCAQQLTTNQLYCAALVTAVMLDMV